MSVNRNFVLCALLLTLACSLSAQPRRGRAGAGGVAETTRIISDCERRTNTFKKTLDRALGRDNVRLGQGREDELNREASRLENQLDKAGDSWNRDHNPDSTRDHVRAAIAVGNDIDRAMRSNRMGPDAEREWAAVRAELNRLAQTFNLPRIR
ncbi:MAG: hypothetical protein HY858_02900 [Candidatus Solibacter usitatus]|nr:hypothetical protein [Candidatus Solibacter usitatus]